MVLGGGFSGLVSFMGGSSRLSIAGWIVRNGLGDRGMSSLVGVFFRWVSRHVEGLLLVFEV